MIRTGRTLIVFDMDGVLVDVSASYREAARMTARLFFKGAPGWERLPEPLFSLGELAAVKQTGGLNNDWDLTYRIIDLLMRRIHRVDDRTAGDPWAVHAAALEKADLTPLLHLLETHDAPLRHLLGETDRQTHPFVRHMSANEVGSGNLIKQIFQELYLGADLFSQTYNFPPRLHKAEGLIDREKLLIDPKTLRNLATGNLLAIATGRPRAEAEYPLRKFRIASYFESVLTLDDCLIAERALGKNSAAAQSLSKPHPYMLDVVAAAHADVVSNRCYIGDMPDDMEAASRSTFEYTGVGFVASALDGNRLGQRLKEAGASHVVNDLEEVFAILNSQAPVSHANP